jgi:hypothetical protein
VTITYIFLGLYPADAIKQNVQTSWQNALVFGGSCHGVRLARRSNSIGKEKAYKIIPGV